MEVDPFLQELREQCFSNGRTILQSLNATLENLKQADESQISACLDALASLASPFQEVKSYLEVLDCAQLGSSFIYISRAIHDVSPRIRSVPSLGKPFAERLQACGTGIEHSIAEGGTYSSTLKDALAALEDWIQSSLETPKPRAEAAPTVTEDTDAPQPHLLCRFGGNFFAIPVQQVIEIITAEEIFPLPIPHRRIQGLLNLRGEAIPVLKAQELLGAHAEQPLGKSLMVIGEIRGKRFAIPVQEVQQLVELKKSSLQSSALQATSADEKPILDELFTMNDQTVLILNLKKMVAA